METVLVDFVIFRSYSLAEKTNIGVDVPVGELLNIHGAKIRANCAKVSSCDRPAPPAGGLDPGKQFCGSF